MKTFLESPILPCLESAYRGGTLLDLFKDTDLYGLSSINNSSF